MKAQSLKNAILQLAVQGKLVPQNPQDEPASELLKKIKAEKATLIKEKKIKAEKPLAPITDDEKPFDIPENWEWVRLNELCSYIQRGKSPKYSDVQKIPVIAQKCNQWVGFSIEKAKFIVPDSIGGYAEDRMLQDYDLMWNSTGIGTLGRIAMYETKLNSYGIAVADSHVTVIRPFKDLVSSLYMLKYFSSPYVQSTIEDKSDGSTNQKELSTSTIKSYLVPLPPLAEQKCIIEKIEQLMPLVEQYDSYEKELSALEAKFPYDLKKSVLQFAVQGKLVPQNSTDEPASELLKKIKAEKAKLIKEKKIKAEKPLAPITDKEKSFEIPDSWEWVRLDELCSYIQRGKSPKYSDVRKIPVIAQKCNQWEGFSIDKAKFIAPDSIKGYAEERLLQDFDLMWNSTGIGTLGRIAMYETRLNLYSVAVADSHVTVIRAFRDFVLSAYLLKYFSSPFVQNVIEDKSDGSTKQKELSTSTIKNYIVPLPPLAEQQRIIKKIEQMLALCDVLTDENKLKKHQPPKRLAKVIEFTSVETEEEHEHIFAARADDKIIPETRTKEQERLALLRKKR